MRKSDDFLPPLHVFHLSGIFTYFFYFSFTFIQDFILLRGLSDPYDMCVVGHEITHIPDRSALPDDAMLPSHDSISCCVHPAVDRLCDLMQLCPVPFHDHPRPPQSARSGTTERRGLMCIADFAHFWSSPFTVTIE